MQIVLSLRNLVVDWLKFSVRRDEIIILFSRAALTPEVGRSLLGRTWELYSS